MKTVFFFCAFFVGLFANTANAYSPDNENKMVAVVIVMQDDDDQKVVATIYTSLMAAEKVAKLMDIEVKASGEVNGDLFVFALKSQKESELVMQLFDEEGFQTVAHRVLEVYEGNNYRALNIETLQDGTYIFQITDTDGNEHKQKVTVNRGNLSL